MTLSQPLRVLFIGGYVRSGSTLLDRILGETPGVVSLGEVRDVWSEGLIKNRRCGCGEAFRGCDYWATVLEKAFGPTGPDVDLMRWLQDRVDRWWRLPTLSRDSTTPELREYANALSAIYRSVADHTGASMVVDSSKGVSHGYVLRHLEPGIEVRVLHLLRDPRAAAYSWQRQKINPGAGRGMDGWPAWRTAIEWGCTNAGVAALRRFGMPYLRVRYEDLMSDPRATLDRILRFAGADAEAPVDGERSVTLSASHTAAGNPDRFRSGRTELRFDAEWRRMMRPRDRLTVTGLCAPGLARNGYSLRTRA